LGGKSFCGGAGGAGAGSGKRDGEQGHNGINKSLKARKRYCRPVKDMDMALVRTWLAKSEARHKSLLLRIEAKMVGLPWVGPIRRDPNRGCWR
jgi:hypothetical protein